jgi:hypothetical protein
MRRRRSTSDRTSAANLNKRPLIIDIEHGGELLLTKACSLNVGG